MRAYSMDLRERALLEALVHGSWALGRVTLDRLVIARAEGA